MYRILLHGSAAGLSGAVLHIKATSTVNWNLQICLEHNARVACSAHRAKVHICCEIGVVVVLTPTAIGHVGDEHLSPVIVNATGELCLLS